MSDLVEQWGHSSIKYVEKIELDQQDWDQGSDEYSILITGDRYNEYDYETVEEAYFKFKSDSIPTLGAVKDWVLECLYNLEQSLWSAKVDFYAKKIYDEIVDISTIKDLSKIGKWFASSRVYTVMFSHYSGISFTYNIADGSKSVVPSNIILPSDKDIKAAARITLLQDDEFRSYYENLVNLIGDGK